MTAPSERLLDLLAARATEGLSGEEEMELRRLAGESGLAPDHFELSAAAVTLAAMDAEAETIALPIEVARALERRADQFLASRPGDRGPAMGGVTTLEPARARPARGSWVAWAAAAACLALAVVGWWDELGGRSRVAEVAEAGAPAAQPTAGATRGERLAEELSQAPDRVELPWTATDDPAGRTVGGRVVWSDDLQKGYMSFSGLQSNDPAHEQYQLWIFDADRDDRYPVDGGVFDVPTAGEVVVPIDAKLPVARATLFAVTVETPGGVVVSSRERIVALAQLG